VHGAVAAEVGEVADGVVPQVGARREPDVPRPPARERVEDDRGELPALANPGAVAEEEAGSCRRVGRHHREVPLAGQANKLQLQRRERPGGDEVRRQGVQQRVRALRWRRGGERRGLGHVRRVRQTGRLRGGLEGHKQLFGDNAQVCLVELLPPCLGRGVGIGRGVAV